MGDGKCFDSVWVGKTIKTKSCFPWVLSMVMEKYDPIRKVILEKFSK
jgi:hypothetical protein